MGDNPESLRYLLETVERLTERAVKAEAIQEQQKQQICELEDRVKTLETRVDIQKKQIDYLEAMSAQSHAYAGQNLKAAEEAQDGEDSPLLQELMPIFKNVRSEAVAFIKAIDGQKPTVVTEKVNELIAEKKILRASCKSDLWGILNKYNLYKPSVQNWNTQVNA